MKNVWFWTIAGLLLGGHAFATEVQITDALGIRFKQPPKHWQVSSEPPAFLLEQHAAHITPDKLRAAAKSGINTPEELAKAMLKGNDLYVFNPVTGAHLDIDFSPLKAGEEPPAASTLKASARFAAESLMDEEGIKGAKSKVSGRTLSDGQRAYQITAEFAKHGLPTRFVGVITYAHRNWIYLYYTGPHWSLDDLSVAAGIIDSFQVLEQH